MPAKVKALHKMLVRKLQAEVREGSNHTKYRIKHEGMVVGSTVLPRSYAEVPDNILAKISREQLMVSRNQLDLLLRCPWSRDDYVSHRIKQSASPNQQ